MKEQNSVTTQMYTLLYDGSSTWDCTNDTALPDYLPDIRRILRVNAVPNVTGTYFNGDHMELEGTLASDLVYMAEDGSIHCFSQSLPFSRTIPLAGLDDSSIVTVHTVSDTSSCRLSGPRKLSVRHKLKSTLRALGQKSAEPQMPETKDPFCLCRVPADTCEMQYVSGTDYRYAEEIPVNDGMLTDILTCTVDAAVTDTHAADGGVLCAGNFLASLLCTIQKPDGSSGCQTLTCQIPFSELVPGDDVPQNSLFEPDITVRPPHTAITDDGRFAALDFSADLSVLCCTPASAMLTTDAFLPSGEIRLKTEEILAYQPLKLLHGRIRTEGTMKYDPSDHITALTDCLCTADIRSTAWQNGRLHTDGVLSMQAILETADHRYVPVSGESPFSWETDLPALSSSDAEQLICLCTCTVTDHSSSLDPSSHSIICQTELSCTVSPGRSMRRSLVTEAAIPPDAKPLPPSREPLILYYPQAGESIWSIAKTYRIPPETVCAANRLDPQTETVPQDTHVLFLPQNSSWELPKL